MNVAFKRIVVATDFSPPSQLAVQYAKTLARKFGAAMHLLYVVEEPYPGGTEFYMQQMPTVRDQLVADGQRRLTATLTEFEMGDATCEVRVGNPARQITDCAETHDADLIVMGTHGRGPIGHLLMGNVAERVVRTAGCPVLTVRKPDAGREAARLRTPAEVSV